MRRKDFFTILVMLILADRVIPENIHSEYASAKQLQSEITAEVIMTTKICTRCHEVRSLSEFYKLETGKNGLHPECKKCDAERKVLYSRTKRGLISRIYNNQRRGSESRGHPYSSYTRIELEKWLFSQPKFHELYDNWVKSGYKKKFSPSCDRLNDYEFYSLNNIQLLTWEEHIKKSHSDQINGVNNKQSKAVLQYDLEDNFIKEYYYEYI